MSASPDRVALPNLRRSLLDVVVVTAPAAVACLLTLGTKSVWLDEAYSVHYASMGLRRVLTEVAVQDPNMALYYGLLSVWIELSGVSEFAVRIPSAVCVILAAPLAYLIGRHAFGRPAGLLGGVLLGLNPFVVQYGQFARGYTLLMLLTMLATWLLILDRERPARRLKVGYALVAVMAFHVHYLGALVVAAHAVGLLIVDRRRLIDRDTVLTGAVIAFWFVSMSAMAWGTGLSRIGWLPRPDFGNVRNLFLQFAGGDPLLLSLLSGASIVGIAFARAERKSSAVILLASWLLVPVALAFAISQAWPMFSARYLISSLPPLILLASYAVSAIRPRLASVAGAALMILLSIGGVRFWHSSPAMEQWRAAVGHVREQAQSGDGMVFVPSFLDVGFDFYAKRGGPALHNLSPERATNRARVWLIVGTQHLGTHARELDASRRTLTRTHELRESFVFEQVRVEEYVR